MVVNARHPPDFGPAHLVSFTVLSGSKLRPLLNLEAGILKMLPIDVALYASFLMPSFGAALFGQVGRKMLE